MKAEIEKILEELVDNSAGCVCLEYKEGECICAKEKALATSSLTALIIKWLESKKEEPKFNSSVEEYERIGRNQLITELIGEVR